jgi:hypothetical protein
MGAALEVADGVFVVQELLSPEECRELIELTDATGREAAPITTASGFVLRPDIRNNTRVILDDPDRAEALWLRVCDDVRTFLRGRQAIGLNERLRFYQSDPCERFAPHRDGAYHRDDGESSLLTLLAYLNEGFSGGATIAEGPPILPRRGMALIIEHQLLHEGAALTRGREYVLGSDVMYGRVGMSRG